MNSIRLMEEKDREDVLEMMRVFYASPAVLSNGSEEIFQADIENCVNNSPYLEGYIFENNGEILGYAMLAKSFSTESEKVFTYSAHSACSQEITNETLLTPSRASTFLGVGTILFNITNLRFK